MAAACLVFLRLGVKGGPSAIDLAKMNFKALIFLNMLTKAIQSDIKTFMPS